MKKYDYEEAITNDIIDYIKDNNVELDWTDTEDNIIEDLTDMLWNEDCITGNGTQYYNTENKCSEYLCQNTDILYEAAQEFCIDDNIITLISHFENKTLARYFDSTIRCYLLDSCIAKAIEILKKEEYEKFFRESDGD